MVAEILTMLHNRCTMLILVSNKKLNVIKQKKQMKPVSL